MPQGRILALDVGDRRIGLAITDPLGLLAQPLYTVHRTNLKADLKSLGRFIRKHNVATLLVGNPLNADGSVGPQAVKTQLFAQALFAANPDLEHRLLDERLTTQEAHALLDSSHARHTAADRLARRHRIDQLAAVVLLQDYLSLLHGPALLPSDEPHP